jgi:D-alanyl-D-alanine carboxypeptidase/D-alanyl-D-alanine-endopeptidase (penicillin-binding protein 4)
MHAIHEYVREYEAFMRGTERSCRFAADMLQFFTDWIGMIGRLAKLCAIGLLLIAITGISDAAPGVSTLPQAVEHTMQALKLLQNDVSIYVRNARTHAVLLDINGNVSRSPASTMKVMTTYAALDLLGPAYTWKTRAFTRGVLRNGTLEGDLILVGGGDPYMTLERWWSFLNGLRQAGLKHINGDIVIDNSLFSSITQDRGDFDQQPFRTYNVLPDALLVNFQATIFHIDADTENNRAQITLDPQPVGFKVRNELKLGAGRCAGYNNGVVFDTPADGASDEVIVHGTFPAACGSYAISRAVMTAPSYTYGVFRTLWDQMGGTVSGKLRLGSMPADATLLYSYDSLTMGEIIRLVNKYSNNVMARHLLLTLAAEKIGPHATVDSGRHVLTDWLHDHQIAINGTEIDNGSGLSREERTSAKTLAAVLQIAYDGPYLPEFAASLPLAATDGTLRHRFRTPAMQARLRMKTGRIDDVSSLAGYVYSSSGTPYIAVIIVNASGAESGPGEQIQNAVVDWLFNQ